METDSARPTPEQARTALADAQQVRTGVSAVSATPWPVWFTSVIAVFAATLPIVYGGYMAESQWLLSRTTWLIVGGALFAAYLALFAVAAAQWRARTGVALRMDVLPKWASISAFIGLTTLLIAAGLVIRTTGDPALVFVTSAVGVVIVIGAHLWFVHLHRKTS